uniref:Cytochrome P450 302a1, mitochondrial n=1 Tax=Lygus hesperus TaxID=30085 RepID=A0A0A9Z7K2_LYGHE
MAKYRSLLRLARRQLSTEAARSFDDIPGPKCVPMIGTAWKYLPFIGDYDMGRLHVTNEKKYKEFGPIVREEVVPGVFIVSVFTPEDIEKVYKAEGKYPARRSHLAVQHFRLSRPHIYNSGGLLPTNGDEWWRLRSAFQKSLSKLQNVREFLPVGDAVVKDFLDRIVGDGADVEDWQPLAARLGLELTWTAMFGERLANFKRPGGQNLDTPARLMFAAESANFCILTTDNTEQLWKRWKTPAYRRIERHLSYIESILLPALLKKKHQIETRDPQEPVGLLEEYFSIKDVDFKDVTGMSVDLILGGIDTTSYTSSFLLWHLTQNPDVQEKLREESKRLLPEDSSQVTSEVLREALYARAVLKETFRLNPIAIGISRNLAEDTVLSGYMVPKNTLVITQNMVACRQIRYFEDPLKFKPDRWVKGSASYNQVSPYLVLPFSHGPRTCIARRLAEQNLLTLLIKLMRNYKLEWIGSGTVGIVTPLICKPDRPVKLRLTPWQ